MGGCAIRLPRRDPRTSTAHLPLRRAHGLRRHHLALTPRSSPAKPTPSNWRIRRARRKGEHRPCFNVEVVDETLRQHLTAWPTSFSTHLFPRRHLPRAGPSSAKRSRWTRTTPRSTLVHETLPRTSGKGHALTAVLRNHQDRLQLQPAGRSRPLRRPASPPPASNGLSAAISLTHDAFVAVRRPYRPGRQHRHPTRPPSPPPPRTPITLKRKEIPPASGSSSALGVPAHRPSTPPSATPSTCSTPCSAAA